jgi:hypothetical protein
MPRTAQADSRAYKRHSADHWVPLFALQRREIRRSSQNVRARPLAIENVLA